MFQKFIAIYLAAFIGIGIDPGCCLRAWISNSAASVLAAPLQFGLPASHGDPDVAVLFCCQESGCVEWTEQSPVSEAEGASNSISCCSQSGGCCSHRTNEKQRDGCHWDGDGDCKCELSKPIDSFSCDSSIWSPILVHVWFSEPIELPAGIIPAAHFREIVCVASPQERLAELCRWNC